MIQLRSVSKQIREFSVLTDVTLSLRAGQVLGIIGPSGAGKSTLLRVMAGIETANSGTMSVAGFDYAFPANPMNQHRPWPKVTLVFQGLCLWPHLTLRTNVMLPVTNRRNVAAPEKAEFYMDLFQIGDLSSRYPNQVSGGQRQLFALCRALALEPEVLLLDEVTAALDVEHIRTLREAIAQLRGNGIAVALVSHSLSFVRRVADTVAFLDKGTIHEIGSSTLLTNPQTDRLRHFLVAADELNDQNSQ